MDGVGAGGVGGGGADHARFAAGVGGRSSDGDRRGERVLGDVSGVADVSGAGGRGAHISGTVGGALKILMFVQSDWTACSFSNRLGDRLAQGVTLLFVSQESHLPVAGHAFLFARCPRPYSRILKICRWTFFVCVCIYEAVY